MSLNHIQKGAKTQIQSKFANENDASMSDELEPVLGKDDTNAGIAGKSKFEENEDIEDEDDSDEENQMEQILSNQQANNIS